MPSPLVQTVGAKWREMAFDDTAWIPTTEERPGGEAEGFWVSSGELRGYLKPSKDAADIAAHPRAAHEKIASDLAFDLKLPVAPAILVDGTASGGKVKAAVVSLVLYREVHKWAHAVASPASTAIARHVLRTTRELWSGMIAFDTWLANTDRNNGGNLVIGVEPNVERPLAEPMFCDFSNSMIYSGWATGGADRVAIPALLPDMLEFFDPVVALATAERIQAYPETRIQEIVGRIPESHLLAAHTECIVDGLRKRRAQLGDVIAALGQK